MMQGLNLGVHLRHVKHALVLQDLPDGWVSVVAAVGGLALGVGLRHSLYVEVAERQELHDSRAGVNEHRALRLLARR
jgi:hypothetical protein